MTERGSGEILKSMGALGLVAVIGTALLSGMSALTADRIAAQERRVVEQQLGQILPPDRYDNDLLNDRFSFRDEAHFPKGQTVTAYRARMGDKPVAVILRFDATRGYNGDIQLLAGILADGGLAGVRVVTHRETPGLGDGIEAQKSDWVFGFDGRSLVNPAGTGWAVKRDGGVFDQFTGATITPRAVVEAVHAALEYHDSRRAALYAAPSGTHTPEAGKEKG